MKRLNEEVIQDEGFKPRKKQRLYTKVNSVNICEQRAPLGEDNEEKGLLAYKIP